MYRGIKKEDETSGDRRLSRGRGREREKERRISRLAGYEVREDKSRIGVINDSGVINCGLH